MSFADLAAGAGKPSLGGKRSCRLSGSVGLLPGAQVEAVKDDAEHIGRNESELRGSETNHADHCAIDGGQNPAFPAALAHKDR